MKFAELLLEAIRQSEIPLRFEPGAEEAVAKPVIDMLRLWIAAHSPADPRTEFERGRRALAMELAAELEEAPESPG
jgi:hypothetical protein